MPLQKRDEQTDGQAVRHWYYLMPQHLFSQEHKIYVKTFKTRYIVVSNPTNIFSYNLTKLTVLKLHPDLKSGNSYDEKKNKK